MRGAVVTGPDSEGLQAGYLDSEFAAEALATIVLYGMDNDRPPAEVAANVLAHLKMHLPSSPVVPSVAAVPVEVPEEIVDAAAMAARHVHGEAFRLMTYRSDDGTETETIWNSRDGVTPFVITLRSGKQATHVNWSDDRYAPDHKPKPGDRIFVDITQERARESAQRNAREWWDGNVAGAQEDYESAEALAVMLADDYFQPGAPDLIEVPAEPVAVVTGPGNPTPPSAGGRRRAPCPGGCDCHWTGPAQANGMAACCDPNDCGPCCEKCPTCPTVQRWAAESDPSAQPESRTA